MALYQSSIGDQLASFDTRLEAFVRRTLLEGGRRFRARMNRERIGGYGSVLNKITGKLYRSFRYIVEKTAAGMRIVGKIGGAGAPYAQDHEEQHRLEFQATFEQEAQKMLSEIQSGMEFFARNPSRGSVSAAGGDVEEGNEGGAGERGRLLSELRSHFAQKRAAAALSRAKRWRSMRRGS